ncbi:ORF6C domain-containing protein [Eubacterium multiforme]|uniref:KilA-N DNA-binding domain-containing protein n=1 Tax=Eubacterium multiforme TaxID=83339 RepID=A0ABT9UXX8_9FIRM|nr:ORF6C domain-containing protein [Eubacterium multiforme]MDQ0151177.1 hypothetical protein [Eubacterium multiforme]
MEVLRKGTNLVRKQLGQTLKVNGVKNIDGMQFHDIEGGFGEGKKAMLVKEIADIHNKEFKHINEAINKNKERFKNNIDIVDLKSVDLIDRDLLKELGFSNSSIANAKNIYLLSERGYAKLLKILEDDVAWEQYDKLVDGYFNMRSEVKKPTSAVDLLELQVKALKEVKNKVEKVDQKFDELPLFKVDAKSLSKLVNSKMTALLGGKKSTAYKTLNKKAFSDLYKQIHREFQVGSIDEIKRKDLDYAKEIVIDYKLPRALREEIESLNNQISFKEEC